MFPQPYIMKRAAFVLQERGRRGVEGVLLILSAEHMLQKMRLKEAAELHRKEQLEKLTGQGSVYILSSLITI